MSESWYDRRILPYLLDFACSMKEIMRQREKVVPRASGTVLEIGIGTGLNMAHYDPTKVNKIIGLDPALQMHRRAKKRIEAAGLNVELIGLSAEKIPLDDASVDTVLMTYTLCSIPDGVSALREMSRVLKPDGKLIFCEHGRAPDESVRRWQDKLTPVWSKFVGGCHLNRYIPSLLNEGGFRSDDLETGYLQGPRPLTFNYWGEASKAEPSRSAARLASPAVPSNKRKSTGL
jgi:ubiquinone/menaquinone biosynthesis C-methylase UbiE